MKNWNLYKEYVKTSFVIYPFDGICFASDRPTHLQFKNDRLHNEKGMSVEFSDGWGWYNLNGVVVSEELVMTPAKKLDVKLILHEKNAEVRREIVRKIGIERVCKELNAKCIDEHNGYELLMLDIGDNRKRPYLKMQNPSIGTWHIEGVPTGITTVRQALTWRNQNENKPIILT